MALRIRQQILRLGRYTIRNRQAPQVYALGRYRGTTWTGNWAWEKIRFGMIRFH